MIVKKKDVEDLIIDCGNSILTVKYPDINYSYWKNLKPYNTDDELSIILCSIAIDLDCSIIFGDKRLIQTSNMMYDYNISLYYYYLLHMEDQELYNFYFDCLITLHRDNIDFELNNPIIIPTPKEMIKSKAKPKINGKFVRQITRDMFNGEETYIYSNSKTGETINSEDPNLLDSLNGIKPIKGKKVKQSKSNVVPISSMTFTFKKKLND